MDPVKPGRVTRVAGPLVEVEDVGPVAVHELVALGPAGTPGEVMAIRDGLVSLQAYEYTGGLGVGAAAVASGKPLSVRLGPGLLGRVHDGLLRPLSDAPTFLVPGVTGEHPGERWHFQPAVRAGDHAGEGTTLGVVRDAGALEHRVLVPPGGGGVVTAVADGECGPATVVAVVGGTEIGLFTDWPVREPRPHRARLEDVTALDTGQRVLDLLYPVAKGSTAAVPGGFGTGKTMLLQQLAKWCDADVIVYTGCGERGNEMAEIVAELFELADPRTGGRLADRTVVIANTSNMPMMAREASVYTAVAVAEYYRDMGYHAVVIADSTSRWAEALREFASRTGTLPAEEGYPADLASALAAFYERACAVETLGGAEGSVTIIGAVSPPGGDLTEPVTAQTERFVRCRWTLDRDLAYARHYPAVSWSGSFSRDVAAVGVQHVRDGDPDWPSRRARVEGLLAEADRLSALAELVGAAAMSGPERATLLAGRLLREALLQQNAFSGADASSPPGKTRALAEAVLAVIDRCRELVGAGADVAAVEEFDFSALVRVREEAGPDDHDTVTRCRDAVLAGLEGLRP
ncbi:V-type ATP synthase subunit A [Amycolatopsis mongoliensis]|uniref:V-type ATP synthase subunit A n=1 Tax=Amycolatopsis mongoliensis TaxID=715475 RepID=A0A9Y2JMP1_9PSEU|nr:V-type ATP synthase subunit A [Amycolatopsis sp. 4-36]WIY00520.1 V-type ATP synthase subunit A [Amycolatopsis sp. 4-36]